MGPTRDNPVLDPSEKKILHEKYKILRNKTATQLRKDTVRQNGERIAEAKDENEM